MNRHDTSIGLLIPTSNRVMEQDFIRWSVPLGWSLHVNRLTAPVQRPTDMRDNLAALTEGVPEAARLLGLASPQVVAFGCTSGSFLRGARWDSELRQDLSRRLGGVPVVSTASAVVIALRAIGARRLAVVSPYPEEVNRLMQCYLEEEGFVVVRMETTDGWRTGNIANVTPESVVDLVRAARTGDCDVCFVSCTNLRAASLVPQLEGELSLPVVTANQATFWACTRVLGHGGPLPLLGRLGALAVPAA